MAKSLAEAGIDTTVIHDAATFAIMARVNKVLLPAHAVLVRRVCFSFNSYLQYIHDLINHNLMYIHNISGQWRSYCSQRF